MKSTVQTTNDMDSVINDWKEETNYFDGGIYLNEMYNMLRFDMHFGIAETEIILASLIKSGAKFDK